LLETHSTRHRVGDGQTVNIRGFQISFPVKVIEAFPPDRDYPLSTTAFSSQTSTGPGLLPGPNPTSAFAGTKPVLPASLKTKYQE